MFMLRHSELTEYTLSYPRHLRGGVFLDIVDEEFDGSRHISHWRRDCIDVLIEEWQVLDREGRGDEYKETLAYLRTYERVLKGLVPRIY